MDFEFELITESEVESTRRGRKPSDAAQAIGAMLASHPRGTIIRISSLTAQGKTEQAKVGQQIRSGAALVGRKVGVRWSPAGVPQVTLKN